LCKILTRGDKFCGEIKHRPISPLICCLSTLADSKS
jgi:hypothetical protein